MAGTGEVSFRMNRSRIKGHLALYGLGCVGYVWSLTWNSHPPGWVFWQILLLVLLVSSSVGAVFILRVLVGDVPAVVLSGDEIQVNTEPFVRVLGRRRRLTWGEVTGASLVQSIKGELLVLQSRSGDVTIHLVWVWPEDRYELRREIGSRVPLKL